MGCLMATSSPQRYFTKSSWPFERGSPFGGRLGRWKGFVLSSFRFATSPNSSPPKIGELTMEVEMQPVTSLVATNWLWRCHLGGSTLVDRGTVLRPSKEPDRLGWIWYLRNLWKKWQFNKQIMDSWNPLFWQSFIANMMFVAFQHVVTISWCACMI